MEPPGDIFDSIYPDMLKTGLGKLGLLDAQRELLALFSALEHFRRDLHAQESADGILRLSQQYIQGLNLFRAAGFWLVSPAELSFEIALASPESERERLDGVVRGEIRAGRFAWALRQSAPVFFAAGPPENPERGLLHALAVSSQVVGMFCGLLRRELAPNQEIVFSLLSLLLGGSADALATLRKTASLTSQINTLSGLLPVCSWCRKVRDDRGYWEQIEKYISSRTAASFTHGICPECRQKWLEDPGAGS
ncbi:MAG: hypothetical protein ABSH38_07760 [Verrucomicrobiota bacterium]|jgi:hypothetical protein